MGGRKAKRKVTNRSNKWEQWFVGNEQERTKTMATDIFYFKGKVKWAKVHTPDPDYDKTKKSYKLDLFMDDESWALFEKSKIQKKVRNTTEGDPKGDYVQFTRPEYKMRKGNYELQSPVKVIDAQNNPITADVGNGSEVICKVSVYDAPKGKGHTLEAVQVLSLVKYEKPTINTLDDMVAF